MSEDVVEPFFLFLGSSTSESSTSRLKASQIRYIQKRLESRTENWQKIIALLDQPELLGTIAKLTSGNIDHMNRDEFRPLARQLFGNLKNSRHIVFVHESIVAPGPLEIADRVSRNSQLIALEREFPGLSDGDTIVGDLSYIPEFYDGWTPQDYFEPPFPEALEFVLTLIRENAIELVPYSTNAELSVLAGQFLEQADKHLLFRIYVPAGRLWASETDKLLVLFRDWLVKVKGQRVRQDGYTTARGHVYEFYGDASSAELTLSTEFQQFSTFLDACIDRPDQALLLLSEENLSSGEVREIVTRYSKEARRLKTDLRHSRETSELSLRHRLEDELSEIGLDDAAIAQISNSIVPRAETFTSALSSATPTWSIASTGTLNINLNQQTIDTVNGVAAQHLQGTVHLGPEPLELIRLIQQFGGDRAAELTSAVHEVEDEDARTEDRISARQKLKAFLYGLGGQATNIGSGLLAKYLELKLGLGGS
ncbi:hypothetical protein [Dactylosporangium sp. NPDC050588]|uniref:hypothetical protein n=1 Tax=Dactylosporangium sp. NPDC050588 TaxID=3157211 RepID=UPI0033F0636E